MNLRDFPVEITEPIRALNEKKRREIVLCLLEKDSRSYSEIQSMLNIKKGTLNHHLNILVSSGLVQNFSIDSPNSPYSSYYMITDFGHKFLSGIRHALEPRTYEIISLIDTTNPSPKKEIDHDLPILSSASEGEEIKHKTLKRHIIVRR